MRPLQRIRATVIGASQFTAQVSGNTIYITNSDRLPLRNLQVVTVHFGDALPTADRVGDFITAALERSEVDQSEGIVALALQWSYGPAYRHLSALCQGITRALSTAMEHRMPIVIVLDCDIARLVGANLSEALDGNFDIICIDGVQLQDFDYIDISKEHADAGVVTVVIKSLVFTG